VLDGENALSNVFIVKDDHGSDFWAVRLDQTANKSTIAEMLKSAAGLQGDVKETLIFRSGLLGSRAVNFPMRFIDEFKKVGSRSNIEHHHFEIAHLWEHPRAVVVGFGSNLGKRTQAVMLASICRLSFERVMHDGGLDQFAATYGTLTSITIQRTQHVPIADRIPLMPIEDSQDEILQGVWQETQVSEVDGGAELP